MISFMTHNLEVVDITDKSDESNTSVCTAKFHSDKVEPTKKGQRDNVPLNVTVMAHNCVFRSNNSIKIHKLQ